jgi:uncharacterized tellurite resistance protein B-like protein
MSAVGEPNMLDRLRDLVRKLGAPEGGRRFEEDDVRLALAALLIHCSEIDGTMSASEQERLAQLLNRTFGVTGDDLRKLLAEALEAERQAVDLYRFTSVLKRQMSDAERIRVVENLWEIVFADGESHEFEENLVWRVSELLGVHSRDRIARKRAVAENKSAGRQDTG